jgi:hypothetical protein
MYIGGKKVLGARIVETKTVVDITQETGDSESAVMSQKAVTDELEKKVDNAELATVEKRLENLEGATVEIKQEMGDSETAVMSQKAVSEHLQKIRTTNNLFTDAELIEGRYFKDMDLLNANYNYFKGIKLEAGNYTVYPSARFIYNVTSGTLIGESVTSLTVESESIYNITISANADDWKLFKSEYVKEEVLPYGAYALNKALKFEQEILPTQVGVAETKNIFTDKEFVKGYFCQVNSSGPYYVAADAYNYFENIVLEAGNYTVYPEARFVCNLTERTQLGDHTKTFTVERKSTFNITVYAKEADWKLFKSDYTEKEIEPLGKYKIKDNILNSNSNILQGKKWCACGDSFTVAGYGTSDGFDESEYKFQDGIYKGKQITYPYIIGLRNDMNIVNLANGGMTMCNIDGTRENSFTNTRYLEIPNDADYITLKFGINDDNYDSPLGTIDDTTTTTFYGAWNVALRHIITSCPYAKIGIIVTNGSSKEYTDATIAIAKKWGIAYIDEVNDPTVPLLHRVDREGVSNEVKQLRLQAFRISETNTHPNVKAHYYEASFIENWLKTL